MVCGHNLTSLILWCRIEIKWLKILDTFKSSTAVGVRSEAIQQDGIAIHCRSDAV